MGKLKSFKQINDLIAQEVKHEIISTIENSATDKWNTIKEIQTLKSRDTDWFPKIVEILLKNLELSHVLDSQYGTDVFERNVLAKIEGVAPNELSAKISIKMNNAVLQESMELLFYGGEQRQSKNPETGETIEAKVFDAHTNYDREALDAAADELRDYFRKKLEYKFKDLEDELKYEIGGTE